MLLPIDFYGISIAGVSVRLYMFFGLLLLILNVSKLKLLINQKHLSLMIIAILLLFLVDFVNGLQLASFLQHMMFAVAFGCALIYLACIKSMDEINEMMDVLVATALGFSVIFMIAVICKLNGFEIAGVSTVSPSLPYTEGIIREMSGSTFGRLRGFQIDPNLLGASLLPATTISLYRLLNKTKEWKRHLIQVILSYFCGYYTNSRMALALFILAPVIIILCFLKKERMLFRVKTVLGSIGIVLFIFLFFLFYSEPLLNGFENFLSDYETRANFADEAGRGTIWLLNLKEMVNTNLLAGVGQGQIRNYTSVDCHNTWVEFIVGDGIIVGIFLIYFFGSVLFSCIRCSKKFPRDHNLTILAVGYSCILFSLTSIDSITNSNLIFLACIILWYISQIEYNAAKQINVNST
ncbi:MAG: hypothetical protein GX434_07630 [Peptococcaceae bacterium]|nr:hypothetical protein [Peptococcaceae bacterium]